MKCTCILFVLLGLIRNIRVNFILLHGMNYPARDFHERTFTFTLQKLKEGGWKSLLPENWKVFWKSERTDSCLLNKGVEPKISCMISLKIVQDILAGSLHICIALLAGRHSRGSYARAPLSVSVICENPTFCFGSWKNRIVCFGASTSGSHLVTHNFLMKICATPPRAVALRF